MRGVGFRIEHLWAYLAVHQPGAANPDEGIVGVAGMPAIGADKDRIEALRPYMVELTSLAGSPQIVLVQFSTRTDLEILQVELAPDMEHHLAVRYIPAKGLFLAVHRLLTGTARLTLSPASEWPYTYADAW